MTGRPACWDAPDPDVFFPDPNDEAGARKALAYCARCPVQAACLAGAVERGEWYGVWGGVRQGQLQALIRQARSTVPVCGRGHEKATHWNWVHGSCRKCAQDRRRDRDRERKRAMRRREAALKETA